MTEADDARRVEPNEPSQPPDEVGRLRACVRRLERELAEERGANARLTAERTEELQRAYHRLKELDRLKNSFMSAVSHELRTPLATIQGFAEFLEDEVGGPLSPDQHEFVARIQDGTRRLRGMVEDLLDFAQLNAGTLALVQQEIDLVPTIEEVVGVIEPQVLAGGLDLVAVVPGAPLVVWADAGRIRQVLLNLLNNAVKFTPSGGCIRVLANQQGQEARIAVQDTGIGIPPEHLSQMFQKFYQVDNSFTRTAGGTGLGLSLSKALVEAHGGRMGVESQVNHGSTFWFTLPLSRASERRGERGELRITLMPDQRLSGVRE